MVGDVRREVGWLAGAPDQDTVFLVAEIAGAEPHGAPVVVEIPAGTQCARRIDLPFSKSCFSETRVEDNAEVTEVRLDLFEQ